MRKINREDVAVPSNLASLYANTQNYSLEVDRIRNNGRAKGNIYGTDTVKSSLVSLYKNICFICQKDVSSGFDIEHFLPWNKHNPERAYDWNNLHQSCKSCNHRKTKKIYKELDSSNSKIVNDIKLLNPSSDDVENLITFDPDNCKAVSVPQAHYKADLTAEFLNELDCLGLRKDHWIKINKLLISNEWFDTYRLLKTDYRDCVNIALDFSRDEDCNVGTLCYRLTVGYLCINTEYNIFMQRIFLENTGVRVALIYKYASEYCQHNGYPLPVTN